MSLAGRRVLLTGVSRRNGIAYTLARRVAADGAAVFATGWAAHDAEQPWGADEAAPPVADHLSLDLAEPDAPRALVRAAR